MWKYLNYATGGILKGATNLRNKVFHIDLLCNPVILLKGVYLREIKLMFTQKLVHES